MDNISVSLGDTLEAAIQLGGNRVMPSTMLWHRAIGHGLVLSMQEHFDNIGIQYASYLAYSFQLLT